MYVQVTDNGSPFYSDSKLYAFSINDVNDPPVFTKGMVRSFPENSNPGTLVGDPFTATDEDAFSSFTFSILSASCVKNGVTTDVTSSFDLITSSNNYAQLTYVNDNVDYESVSSYTVRVSVSDGKSSNTTDIIVNVIDVNEAPIVLSEAVIVPILVPEGTATSTGLQIIAGLDLRAYVKDPDTPLTPQALSFQVVAYTPSNPSSLFLVYNAYQVQAYKTNIDFETTAVTFPGGYANTYQVSIKCSDSLGLSVIFTLLFQITNVNEPPSQFLPMPSLSIPENTPAASSADYSVLVKVSDPDKNDSWKYEIVSTDPSFSKFKINANTGLMTLTDGSTFDYETSNSFTVSVKITDSGGLFCVSKVKILITDVNEAPYMVILK